MSPKSPLAKLDVVDVTNLAGYTFLCVADKGMEPEMAYAAFGCEKAIDADQVEELLHPRGPEPLRAGLGAQRELHHDFIGKEAQHSRG